MGIRQEDTLNVTSPAPSALLPAAAAVSAPVPVARPSIFHRHHDEAVEAMRIAQANLDQARLSKPTTWNNPAGPYGFSNFSSPGPTKSSSSNNFSSLPADPWKVSPSPSTSSKASSAQIAKLPILLKPQVPIITPVPVRPTSKCNICFDDFYFSSNPYESTLLRSEAGPYGLSIGRKEDKHQYCSDCLKTYIEAKLSGDGKAFPVKCPEVSCTFSIRR